MDEQDKDRRDFRERRNEAPRRKPLKLDIAEVDQEILRLLIRRHNMLARMRDRKGRLDPAEEKFLRESWQAAVAKVSRDASLSGHFFTLMQEISFLPRPAKGDEPETALKGADRRQSFNLAPPRQPVTINMQAPAASFSSSAWLYLAASQGAKIQLANCLMNDGEVDLVKALNQMGAALTREEASIISRAATPLGAPDKVLHLGDSFLNLYIVLAHYLGRPARVKLSGDSILKLADLSFLHSFLRELGARLVHVVPKSGGLPARLESSGLLPPGIEFTADLPPMLGCALLLAAPSWTSPFALDLTPHPQKHNILARALPILEQAGAVFKVDGQAVSIEPSPLTLPPKPDLPMEPMLGAFLLALAAPEGGSVNLSGHWPDWPDCGGLWGIMEAMGLAVKKCLGLVSIEQDKAARVVSPDALPDKLIAGMDEDFLPLPIALASFAALRGEAEQLPTTWPLHADTGSFLHSLGLEADETGRIRADKNTQDAPTFNAPRPAWALALALAAMGRARGQAVRLGNPGVMTALWPGFWALYNSLPTPQTKTRGETSEKPRNRRRIITDAVAVPPEIKEEDWY